MLSLTAKTSTIRCRFLGRDPQPTSCFPVFQLVIFRGCLPMVTWWPILEAGRRQTLRLRVITFVLMEMNLSLMEVCWWMTSLLSYHVLAECFKDHLGVELASEAHARMLVAESLLREGSRLRADRALIDDSVVEGLYIDDFFKLWSGKSTLVLGLEEALLPVHQRCSIAKDIYAAQGATGSDDKDVLDQLCFKVVSSEIDSRPSLVQ